MAENVTNELILENLKAIQGKLTIIAGDITDLKADMLTVKGHMAAFMQAEIHQDSAAASLTARVERLERRLDLRD